MSDRELSGTQGGHEGHRVWEKSRVDSGEMRSEEREFEKDRLQL